MKVQLSFDRAQLLGRPLPRASCRCSLGEIARYLRQQGNDGLGCVLIQERSDGGAPLGLITATDLLAAVCELGWETQTVDSLDLAAPVVVPLERLDDPGGLLLTMADHQSDRLLVLDGQGQAAGIVTLADAAGAVAAGLTPLLHQQKLSNIQLRTSAEMMRSTLEALPDVVLILDARGERVDLVPTRPALLDGREAEVVGETITRFVEGEGAERWLIPVREALALGRPVQFEYTLMVADECLSFVASVAPMTDDTVLWVARDVTFIKGAERSAQVANENLESWVKTLEQREQERTSLLELSGLLQDLGSMEELEALVPLTLERILGPLGGGLWIAPGQRQPSSLHLTWGLERGNGFSPEHCGLLDGRLATEVSFNLDEDCERPQEEGNVPDGKAPEVNDHIRIHHCIPLRDRGRTVGVLRLVQGGDGGEPSASFLTLLGERLLLSFLNLQDRPTGADADPTVAKGPERKDGSDFEGRC